jgi:hypothetical protein
VRGTLMSKIFWSNFLFLKENPVFLRLQNSTKVVASFPSSAPIGQDEGELDL